jgi:cysteine desulfurase
VTENNFVYFDNINNTKVAPEVIKAINAILESNPGNPSSHVHAAGVNSGKIIEEARVKVADLLSVTPNTIIFTSGATESNNLAIRGFLNTNPKYGFVTSNIEHFSILNQARKIRMTGNSVEILPVNIDGSVNLNLLKSVLDLGPALVSIAIANPEIGTIQEIEAISEICHSADSILHCDATAAAGLIELNISELGIDLLTLSAHNMHGPSGVGALFVKENLNLTSLFDGGNQERGIRPGTENVPGIAGFGEACMLAKNELPERVKHLKKIGEKLWSGISEKVPFINFTGHPENRLPGHVSFWVKHIEGESLLLLLSMKGIMVSSGSACSSNLKAKDEDELKASHVLTAVGVPSDICAGSITFSSSKFNTIEDVDYVMTVLPGLVERLLSMSPSYEDYIKGQETSNE